MRGVLATMVLAAGLAACGGELIEAGGRHLVHRHTVAGVEVLAETWWVE